MKDSDWEVLYELYKTPNITKVANLLYITQPSLTKRLKSIEDEFQIKIVDRTSKGVTFTPEGEYLAKQANKYMQFIKETKHELDLFKENAKGSISVGSAYTYSKYHLTELLFKYSQFNPNTNFEIVNEQSNVLFHKVIDSKVDVAFVRGDYNGGINKILVQSDDAYIVSKGPIDINDLPNMQRINYSLNDKSRELINSWWYEKFQSNSPSGMLIGYSDFAWQLVDKGFGYTICFLPKSFDNPYDLTITPLIKDDGSRVSRNSWCIYSQFNKNSKSLNEFIKYIKDNLEIKEDTKEKTKI